MLSSGRVAVGKNQSNAVTISADRYDPFLCTCTFMYGVNVGLFSKFLMISPSGEPLNRTANFGGSGISVPAASCDQDGTEVRMVYLSFICL